MNNLSDFYDNLDLKYPEIGIALDSYFDEDKKCYITKFSIPVLTPNMDNTRIINNKIYKNKVNLMNANKNSFEVSDIVVTNYVNIPVPMEICPENGIENGSKWVIVFVGGDITKPRAIARYIELA